MSAFFKIVITRNKKIIQPSEEEGISVESDMHMHIVRLIIKESEINKHDGTYQISASNKAGEAKFSVQVNIKPNPMLKKKSKPKEK